MIGDIDNGKVDVRLVQSRACSDKGTAQPDVQTAKRKSHDHTMHGRRVLQENREEIEKRHQVCPQSARAATFSLYLTFRAGMSIYAAILGCAALNASIQHGGRSSPVSSILFVNFWRRQMRKERSNAIECGAQGKRKMLIEG